MRTTEAELLSYYLFLEQSIEEGFNLVTLAFGHMHVFQIWPT